MTQERWQVLKALFQSLVERSLAQRASILNKRCADADMRAQLESLLRHDEAPGSLLNSPAWDIDAAIASPRLSAGEYVGRYRVAELLGTGGMGEVYRATDTRLGRSVALKLLSSVRSRAHDSKQLLREARTASALRHPNICTIHDIDEHKGEPFIVMELLEGSSLQDILAAGPLRIRMLLEIAIRIAQGLAAAHASGVVHRDIKPANIFVGSDGRIAILDFGVAQLNEGAAADHQPDPRSLGNPSRIFTRVAGTPAYMSPEQIQGLRVDRRTDLYALGLVLYEMATGCTPVRANTMSRSRGSEARGEAFVATDAKIPRALARIIRRATRADPRERYQSATELLADVERASKRLRHGPPSIAAALLVAVGAAAAGMWVHRGSSDVMPRREWEQITNFSDSVVEPALSADGRSVAFLRGSRTFTTLGDVYVMDLRDRTPRRLTADDRTKMAPVFTPDGLSIAFTRLDEKWSWDIHDK